MLAPSEDESMPGASQSGSLDRAPWPLIHECPGRRKGALAKLASRPTLSLMKPMKKTRPGPKALRPQQLSPRQ